MLNILVCVKQVPDVDLVKMDPETGNLIRTGVPTLTNPLDLNALEQSSLHIEKMILYARASHFLWTPRFSWSRRAMS